MTHRFIPRLSPEEIARQQLEGLRFTVRQAFKSPQYRKRLEACGVTPDDITSLDDLRRLPTVDVEDLREGYPLPLLCVPEEEVVRIHASSGTTGKRKILAYTANDVNNFTLQMARCYEMAGLTPMDRMQVAVGDAPERRIKPAPDSVLRALELLGSSKDEAVYIGDSEVDYATALAAGLPYLIVTWGFRTKEELAATGAQCFIDRPEQILNFAPTL